MPIIKDAELHDPFGRHIVTVAPMGGSAKTFVSPNMCDKTGWWWDSTDVVDEVMSDSGDGLTFNSVNTYWVDKAGIVDSHEIVGKDVVVKVDDVVVETGFSVDHVTGTVTFDADTSASVVKASYAAAGTPTWELIPAEGKVLRIIMAEVQISKNFVFNTAIYFEILVQAGAEGNWVTAGTNLYKNAKDLIGRANRGYIVPAFGELEQDVVVMPFEYPAVIDLTYTREGFISPAMKIRVGLVDAVEMGGEWGTVALYCLSEDE